MKLMRGVIENNVSPDKNGRVQVRILGLHTGKNENSGEEFEYIQTSDLPWALVAGSTELGVNSGIGLSRVLPTGTWVWVLIDEHETNIPVVIGTILGTPTVSSAGKYSGGEGFFDPNEIFPLDDRLNEPDMNEIARGSLKNTVIETVKNVNLDKSDVYTEVKQAPGVYPDVTVFESKSGHVMEFDDTEGAERVQIIDKNGNYIEMKLDAFIEKSVKNKVQLIMGDFIQHIKGDYKTLIEGKKSEIYKGNFEIKAPKYKFENDSNELITVMNDIMAELKKISGALAGETAVTGNGMPLTGIVTYTSSDIQLGFLKDKLTTFNA